MPTQRGNILIVLVILAAITVGGFVYYKSGIPTTIPNRVSTSTELISTNSAEQTTIFKSSSTMKFSIKVPSSYKVSEKLGSVTINTETGQILISRNGTNFDNLKDYINYSQNNLKNRMKNQQELTINELDAISASIDNENIYYIYTENAVYSISTSTEALFDDLDKIAQSFKYTP